MGYELLAENESYLRKFFMHLFSDLYDLNIKNIGLEIDYNFLKKFTQSRMNKYRFVYSDKIYSLLSFLTLITLVRENQGYTLDCSLRNDQDTITLNHFKYDFPFLPDNTLCNIEGSILDFAIGDKTDEILDIAISDFFIAVESQFNLVISFDDRHSIHTYLTNIYFKFHIYPFKTPVALDTASEFSKAIKKENPEAMIEFSSIIKTFTETTNLNFEVTENSIIYWVISHVPEIISTPFRTKNILYLSNLGDTHGEFVARLIKATFRAYANHADMVIEVANLEKPLKLDYLNQYDCILNNLRNLNLPLEKILVINDLPTDKDLFNILTVLNK